MRTHPQIYLPPGKEHPFFSHDDAHQGGWDAYAATMFGGASRERLWGTSSAHYMAGAPMRSAPTAEDQWGAPETEIPRRIAALFPSVRLIALLRDPIARAMSQHRMYLMWGAERRSLDVAMRESLLPERLELARSTPTEYNSYVVWGEYGRILSGYLEVFQRPSLLALSTSALETAPLETMAEVWRYLGVDDSHRPPNLGIRYRVSAGKRRVPQADLYAVRERFRTKRRIIAAWQRLPPRLRSTGWRAYERAAYALDLWNRARDPGPPEGPGPDVIAELKQHFAPDHARLRELVGEVPGFTFYDDAEG
jgi:hypothetical protein